MPHDAEGGKSGIVCLPGKMGCYSSRDKREAAPFSFHEGVILSSAPHSVGRRTDYRQHGGERELHCCVKKGNGIAATEKTPTRIVTYQRKRKGTL